MNQISADFEKYGGSYLISDENYEKYINGVDNIGRPDGQFMTPSNQMDDLLQNHSNNPREWERQLGLGENSLGDSNIRRVDVYNPQNYNPRLPGSGLSGSNDKFISGGKTIGGLDECVIDRFPNPENNPSIGKITNIDNGLGKDSTNSSIDTKTSSPSDKVSDGGGARAPNDNIRGNTDNPPTEKNPSPERGQKPPRDADNPQLQETTQRGHLPENTSKVDPTNSPNSEATKAAEEASKNVAEQQANTVSSAAGMGV